MPLYHLMVLRPYVESVSLNLSQKQKSIYLWTGKRPVKVNQIRWFQFFLRRFAIWLSIAARLKKKLKCLRFMITSSYTHIYIYIVQRLSLYIVTVYLVISKTQRSRIVQKVFVLQNQIVARLTKQNKTFIFHYEIEIINNCLLATKDFVPHLNDLRYAYNYRF